MCVIYVIRRHCGQPDRGQEPEAAAAPVERAGLVPVHLQHGGCQDIGGTKKGQIN